MNSWATMVSGPSSGIRRRALAGGVRWRAVSCASGSRSQNGGGSSASTEWGEWGHTRASASQVRQGRPHMATHLV